MKVFKCEEIACEHCVARIEKALTGAGIGHKVDLAQKLVTIEEDAKVKEAVDLLDDLGFTAVEQ